MPVIAVAEGRRGRGTGRPGESSRVGKAGRLLILPGGLDSDTRAPNGTELGYRARGSGRHQALAVARELNFRNRYQPLTASFSSRNAAARRGGCQDALRPLGLGRIQRRAVARGPAWGPMRALGRAKAVR
jgi:hypothetical protein